MQLLCSLSKQCVRTYSSLAPYSQFGNVFKKIKQVSELNKVIDMLENQFVGDDIANAYYILPTLNDQSEQLATVEKRLNEILNNQIQNLSPANLSVIIFTLTKSVPRQESIRSQSIQKIYVRRKELAFSLIQQFLNQKQFQSIDAQNVAVILTSMASTGKLNPEQQSILNKLFDEISSRICASNLMMNSRQMGLDIATIFHACSKQNYYNQELFDYFARFAKEDKFATFVTPRNIHTIFISCARLKYNNPEFFADLSDILMEEKPKKSKKQEYQLRSVDVAAILYSCAKLKYQNQNLFQYLVETVQMNDLLKNCSVQDLSNILQALTILQYNDQSFVGQIFDVVWQTNMLQQISGYNLANLFKYMHALNYKDAQVLRAIGNELKSRKFLPQVELNSTRMEISADRLASILNILGELKYTENVPLIDFLVSQIKHVIDVFNITSLQQIVQGIIQLQYKDVQLINQIYDISKQDQQMWVDMVPHLLHVHAIFLIDLPKYLVNYLNNNIQNYSDPSLFCGLIHSLAISNRLNKVHLQKCLQNLCQQRTLNDDDLTFLGAGLCYWKYIKKGEDIVIEYVEKNQQNANQEQNPSFQLDLLEQKGGSDQQFSNLMQNNKLQEQQILNIQLDAVNCWKNFVQNRTTGLFVRDVTKTLREMGVEFLQFVPLELGAEIGDIMIFQKCVVVFGFSAFTTTQPFSLLGDSALRVDLLKSFGYDVSCIVQHEWQDLDNKERVEYLRKIIKTTN